MRLAYLVELIVACAVGFAVARWELGGPEAAVAGDHSAVVTGLLWLTQAGIGLIMGVGSVGLVGLAIEVVQGRSPRPWGLGRWAWSLVGLWLVSSPLVAMLVAFAFQFSGKTEPWPDFLSGLSDMLRLTVYVGEQDNLFCLILSLAIVRRVAAPGPVVTDAREWAGRAFAVLAASFGLGSDIAMRLSVFQ